MANIGNLALMLSVNPTEFTAGLNKAMSELQSFVGKASSFVSKPAAIVGGLLGIGGLGAGLTEGLSQIAETAKGADKLGISMRDMAAFQLLAGGASEQMNHALGKLNATIGGARAGSEEAAKKLEAVGLSAQTFAGKNTAESYRILADAIARVPDAAQRAFVAHELLGKGGAELVGILQKGSAAFDQAAQKAQEYGMILDREVAQRAIAAEKATAGLGNAIKGLWQQVSIQAAPAIEKFSNILNAMVQKPGAFLQLFNPFGNADEQVSRAIQNVERQNAALAKLKQQDESALAEGKRAAGFVASLDKAQKEMQFELDTMEMGINEKKAMKLATDAVTASEKKMADEFLAGARAFDAEMDAIKEHKKIMEELEKDTGKILEDNMSNLEKFRKDMGNLKFLEQEGFLSKGDQMKAAKRYADSFKDALGLGTAPGVVSAEEAGSLAAQKTLAQAEARNSFAWADDLKSLLAAANQINAENGRKLQEWIDKNEKVLAASF